MRNEYDDQFWRVEFKLFLRYFTLQIASTLCGVQNTPNEVK